MSLSASGRVQAAHWHQMGIQAMPPAGVQMVLTPRTDMREAPSACLVRPGL